MKISQSLFHGMADNTVTILLLLQYVKCKIF